MEVRHTEQLLADLSKLSSSLQKKCWRMLSAIQKGDAGILRDRTVPGWRPHRLKSSPFISLSVDMNYRLLCKRDGDIFYAFRVVKHDLADSPHINRNEGADAPYALDDTTIRARDVFAALVSMGLPAESVAPFRGIDDEEGFIQALDQVPPAIQTYAFAIYETSGVVLPRSKYTIFDAGSTFEDVLRAGMQEWQIYLHPSQRYIVELPASHRVSVSGSAGTGKTVCAWYRIQHLVREGYSVGFICPTKRILEVSRHQLEALLQTTTADSNYYLVPNSSDEVVQLAEAVDHVVVDEGQEFATNWLSVLGRALSKIDTGLTLFFDLNQLGGNIPAGDTKHINHRLDTWHTRLNSIPTLYNIPLHINYRNSREIAEYHREILAPILPSILQSPVPLPLFETGEVLVETVRDRTELGFQIARFIRALRMEYDDSEIGLILNGSTRENIRTILTELARLGIRTTSDIENTQMILTGSPREMKGHERKAIVFCTPPMKRATRKLGHAINVYVALTRARDRLVVLESP